MTIPWLSVCLFFHFLLHWGLSPVTLCHSYVSLSNDGGTCTNLGTLGGYKTLWNVSVSTSLRKYLPALQETHLTRDTVSGLNFAWVERAYHSTHTTYSRGVSVLVHDSLDYEELHWLQAGWGNMCFYFVDCTLWNLFSPLCTFLPHTRIKPLGHCSNISWSTQTSLYM